MNIPDDLELVDAQGNARKNGEERKAVNSILEYLRWRESLRAWNGKSDEHPEPQVPQPRMTVNTSVPAWSAASRQAEEEEIAPGTVWEKFGPDSPFVMVKEGRGWSQERREASHVRAMVIEDEERDSPENA